MPPIVDDLKMNNVLAYQSGRFGIRIADQERNTPDLRPGALAGSLATVCDPNFAADRRSRALGSKRSLGRARSLAKRTIHSNSRQIGARMRPGCSAKHLERDRRFLKRFGDINWMIFLFFENLNDLTSYSNLAVLIQF